MGSVRRTRRAPWTNTTVVSVDMFASEAKSAEAAGLRRSPRSSSRLADRSCLCSGPKLDPRDWMTTDSEAAKSLLPKQARQESNLQPPVLETGALPIELRTSDTLGLEVTDSGVSVE